MPKEVKYGYLYGPRVIVKAWPIAASQVINDRGGKFVKLDSSDRIDIADSGDTQIEGWLEHPTGQGLRAGFTTSATAGADEGEVDVSELSVYRIIADADPANTRGESCDLIITSDVQYADIGESNEDVIVILDLDTTDDTVNVRMNSIKMYAAGVA